MECQHFIVDFVPHMSGFNSAHVGAKTVANLHVNPTRSQYSDTFGILRGKKYQERLNVISILATCSFLRQT